LKLGVQFDEQGNFVGDFLEGMQLPEEHTLYRGEIIEGLYVPKLLRGEVVEVLSSEEIEEIRNQPQSETSEQKIARLEAENIALQAADLDNKEAIAVLYEMLVGGETNE